MMFILLLCLMLLLLTLVIQLLIDVYICGIIQTNFYNTLITPYYQQLIIIIIDIECNTHTECYQYATSASSCIASLYVILFD